MAETSRLDDLRKRYHENPRRFFAPLANEYRKTGFLDRALLLCEKHVGEQPDNMNGQVVYGQVLFETGRHEEARGPFERALALDPENLIALRHLGDIARLGGDQATAKTWYEKVLELDRRNDEVLDLLQQMGGGDAEPPASDARSAAGLISVAPSVSVSGGDALDIGMVDLGEPAPAPAPKPKSAPKTPAGPGRTKVIDVQALVAADRRESEAVQAAPEVAAAAPPASSAKAPPTKRASLLDVDFDFSELPEPESAKPKPAAPVLGAEAAEYGFADSGIADAMAAAHGDETLRIEPSASGESLAAPSAPALPAGDFELAEFSSDVSPLAGLEANEFNAEAAAAAPLADLDEPGSLPSAVAPLADLDRVDVTADDVEPLSGLSGLEPTAAEPADAVGLPLLDEPEAAAPSASASAPDLLADLPMIEEPASAPPPSGPPRPRMTKSDMASLPLLADFGLEDDAEPAPIAETPSAAPIAAAAEPRRPSQTPTFVTETMAELYLKQGYRKEALGVYRQLIAQSPGDAGLRAKLAALEAEDQGLPEFDAPSADAREPEPAPANAALADVSFAGVGLQTPGGATPVLTPAVPAGPTAREFFGAFARRAAVAATVATIVAAVPAEAEAIGEPPTAVTASGWPLDALFGAASDVRDLHAAETIAGIATFEGPDGGTGLGALFADAGGRRNVPRASDSLKFDQFFAAPGTERASPPPSDAPGDDDLDQFQGWLKGLKK
jgi:tetratricopeptide (TPR) repeat protein